MLLDANKGPLGFLQEQSFGKQPKGIGIHAEQGKKDYEQKKRTRTNSHTTQTQPALLAADAFAAGLKAIPRRLVQDLGLAGRSC
jgi:hypothetical protein